jgi:hypothetical protein
MHVHRRPGRPLAAILTMAALGLGSAASVAAQSTTTTTSTSTTTTTLLPHPFSKSTKGCVRKAKADRGKCRREGTPPADCSTAYQSAYANCFASPAGVGCARRCVQRQSSCYAALPATKKACRKNCRLALANDQAACALIADGRHIWAGGDASCLTTAQSTYDQCLFVCSIASVDCTNAFRFCIANCANL